MSRGQMEMLGLVFVVVILVLGIVLYVSFASRSTAPTSAKQVQASNAFLTALSETYVPACNVRFFEAARACVQKSKAFVCSDPCFEIQRAIEIIANSTLMVEGLKYNLSLSGTNVQNSSRCNSTNPNTLIASAPQVAIVLGGGQVTNLTLAICR